MNAKLLSKATNILKNAGCTEVYLFGSYATGKAHSGSDVDLGMRGLPPRLLFRMHSDLEEALRMPVDLVDFDSQVDFYNLLQRLGELRKIGQFYTGKINLEISKIDTLVDKSSLLLEKCKFSEPDFFDLNAIGSILHSFYNGLESIFKLIHKANGGKTLTNTMWHSELFYSMFEETKSRNAVLQKELTEPLKDYLGVRHVFRHSYGYELDWLRLNPLFSGMADV